MMLEGKHAMVFAATGAIGGEVARKFAREGAHVYVSGRRQEALDALVEEIASEGGRSGRPLRRPPLLPSRTTARPEAR